MTNESDRERIVRELNASRQQLNHDLVDLSEAINVRERFKNSVRRNPEWWIAGGLAAGIIAANLLGSGRRSGKAPKGASDSVMKLTRQSLFLGLLSGAGKQILRVAEPALKEYAKQEIERFIGSRQSAERPASSDQNDTPS